VLYLFPVSDNTTHKTIYLYIIGLGCQTERCNYLIIGLLISSWSFVFFMAARIVLSHCVTEHFGSVWITLDHFGSIWITLDHFGPFWLSLDYIGSFWLNLAQFGLHWIILAKFGIHWIILTQFG